MSEIAARGIRRRHFGNLRIPKAYVRKVVCFAHRPGLRRLIFPRALLRSSPLSKVVPCERERYSFPPQAQAANRLDGLQAKFGESGADGNVVVVDVVVVEGAVGVHVRSVVLIVTGGTQPPPPIQYHTQMNAHDGRLSLLLHALLVGYHPCAEQIFRVINLLADLLELLGLNGLHFHCNLRKIHQQLEC